MRNVITIFIILYSLTAYSQNRIDYHENENVHLGLSLKLNIEFGMHNPTFKLSTALGIGYDLKIESEIEDINLFPTIHTGFIIFNRGAIGSDLRKKWYNLSGNFFFNTIATLKLDKRDYGYDERYVPFYHFADFTANPLQNPYKTSLSCGIIWVTMPNHKLKRKFQRIGMLNLNIAGKGQITYYNDGGPITKKAGDKHDRYYTGGIVFSYHLDNTFEINLIELSFHKFTGYTPHAFDIANKMQFDFLLYADKEQIGFNQQRWKLNVSNVNNGFGTSISAYNLNKKDLQDILHYKGNNPYHPDYYKNRWFMIGGVYNYNYLKIEK